MAWNTIDQPTQGLSAFQNGTGATFTSALVKPLATGGVAGVSFGTTYQLLSMPPTIPGFTFVNPSYTTSLQVGFEQPLLRGYGVDINQVLPGYASSLLFPSVNTRKAGTP